MAMVDADWTIERSSGNIRYVGDDHGGSPTYATTIQFHRWLQDFADQESSGSSDDELDITDLNPSERATNNIIKLINGYQIDDTAAEHLYDGSVEQGADATHTIYSGLVVVGAIESGTELQIIQDNRVLAPYWTTGLNSDAAANILMRIMVKTRYNGADIDGKKLRVQARELGDKYGEFSLTAGLGNSTAAVFTSGDLNNTSSDTAIEAWSTIDNTEGYQEIDIDGTGLTDQEFYSQWDKGSQSINETYERTKWISQRSHYPDFNSDTATSYTVDDATITGQAQEFTSNGQVERLTGCQFGLKQGAGEPTGLMYAELYASDAGSPAAPTGGALATSEGVEANRLTTTLDFVKFVFNDNYEMAASTEYFIAIRHPDGTAGAYVGVDGAASGTHAGNRAEDDSGWSGSAPTDLGFVVYSSPSIHSMAGEIFRGITHEVYYDNEASGPFVEDERIFWGTRITYDGLGGSFTVGEYVHFLDEGTSDVINGGKVLKDTGTILTVALEDLSGNLSNNDEIIGISSGADADIATTITDPTKAGGEGILLALDDNTSDGELYLQLISGSAPVDLLYMEGDGGANALVATTINAKTVSPEFIGTSTGTNIIGAYGIGFEVADVGLGDIFTDLQDGTRYPENVVEFILSGAETTNDRILITNDESTGIDYDQMTLNGALTGVTTTVTVNGAIPADTPASGTIRILRVSGIYSRHPYSVWSGSAFTITSHDFGSDNAANGANTFVSYLDKAATATNSFSVVYSAPRTLFIRVRSAASSPPIKTFETTAALTSTGGTGTVIRTPDA